MSLPNMSDKSIMNREVRTEWGGLNLNESAGDGELIEAMNMSSREFPLLATAAKPTLVRSLSEMRSPVMYDKVFYVHYESNQDIYFISDPEEIDDSRKISIAFDDIPKMRYGPMQKRIYMFPNKQYYDCSSETVKEMGASAALAGAVFQDQSESVKNNTIYKSGALWKNYFSAGDAVRIRSYIVNKTAIIQSVSNNSIRFYEDTFPDGYSYCALPNGLEAGTYALDGYGRSIILNSAWSHAGAAYYTGGGYVDLVYYDSNTDLYQVLAVPTVTGATPDSTITFTSGILELAGTITRAVPDMDYVCVNENRLWGCKGDTIYASALGDPLNFNVFDGLATDSWTAETGTEGDFTGCVSFQGYPAFFKKNAVFRVVGDTPQNFYLRKQNISGVDGGCDLSIVEIRGVLYYQSPVGIVAWTGGDYPGIISEALDIDFTERLVSDDGVYPNAKVWSEGIAGTDGARYYISLQHRTKRLYQGFVLLDQKYRLLVYDTRFGTWHEMEDTSPIDNRVRFLWNGSDSRMVMAYKEGSDPPVFNELRIPGDSHSPKLASESGTPWTVTFADSTRAYKTVLTGSESKKGVLRLLIRCKLAGTMTVWLSYDGGAFEEAKEIGGEDGAEKSSYVVPLILRRCDFWQLRLTGTDDAVIYSIAVERYGGEWQQAK